MRTGTSGTDDDNVGIFFRHAFIYILEALDELGRDLLFIAYTEIFQVEGLGMTGIGPHLRPLVRGGVAIGPLDEVDGLSHPFVHL